MDGHAVGGGPEAVLHRRHHTQLPQADDAALDAISGRGLAIIAAYSKDTGVRPSATGEGKIVWALMPSEDTAPVPP